MLFERMPGERVQRNTITYSAAISAWEKGKPWQQAVQLFGRMQGECAPLNTYGKLLLLRLLLPVGVSE